MWRLHPGVLRHYHERYGRLKAPENRDGGTHFVGEKGMTWSDVYWDDTAEIRFSSDITGDDILEAKRRFFAHPFAAAPRYVLCDFSPVRSFAVSLADVRRIVEQDRAAARKQPGVVEVVVAPTPVEYGSARMWEMLVEDARAQTKVGVTRAEVLAWLEDQGVELNDEHRQELAAARTRSA
jgi:hypothetical protein